MTEILEIVNQLSPLGVIALSLLIIWQLTMQKRSVDNLKSNHLHDLANIIRDHEQREYEQFQSLMESNRRIENVLVEIKAKINGKRN